MHAHGLVRSLTRPVRPGLNSPSFFNVFASCTKRHLSPNLQPYYWTQNWQETGLCVYATHCSQCKTHLQDPLSLNSKHVSPFELPFSLALSLSFSRPPLSLSRRRSSLRGTEGGGGKRDKARVCSCASCKKCTHVCQLRLTLEYDRLSLSLLRLRASLRVYLMSCSR